MQPSRLHFGGGRPRDNRRLSLVTNIAFLLVLRRAKSGHGKKEVPRCARNDDGWACFGFPRLRSGKGWVHAKQITTAGLAWLDAVRSDGATGRRDTPAAPDAIYSAAGECPLSTLG